MKRDFIIDTSEEYAYFFRRLCTLHCLEKVDSARFFSLTVNSLCASFSGKVINLKSITDTMSVTESDKTALAEMHNELFHSLKNKIERVLGKQRQQVELKAFDEAYVVLKVL